MAALKQSAATARPSASARLSPNTDGGPPPLAITSDKPRRAWIDVARGIAILLVVIGHTVRGLFNAQILASDGAWGFVDRWIYAFHMPLFFVLAGLFTLPGRGETYPAFAKKRLLRLGYPYLLWATLQTLVQVALSRYTNRPMALSDLWTIVYLPPMQFWFLYALLIQVLLIGVLWKLHVPRLGIFLIGLALYLIGPYLSLGEWFPLYQARDGLVYTGLGVLLGEPARLQAIERRPIASFALAAALGLGLTTVGVLLKLEQHHLAALLLALSGAAAVVAVGLLLEHVGSAALLRGRDHLALWGAASLAIFVAHTLASAAVRIALQKVLHVESAPVHLVAGVLVGLYAPLAMYLVAQRHHFPYLFEWPVSPARAPKRQRPSLPSRITPSPRA